MEEKTFLDLATETSEQFVLAIEQIQLCLREVVHGLMHHAATGSDMVVAAEQEDGKRQCIRVWRDEAYRLSLLADAVGQDPPSANEIYREMKDMLLHGAQLAEKDIPWTALSVRTFIDERAKNIAQAYAGRVLREPRR